MILKEICPLKFDALTLRVSLEPYEIADFFEGLDFELMPASARYGYQAAYSLNRNGLSHGLIQYAGDNVGVGVYVSVMGGFADQLWYLIRDWPALLIRADVAFDFEGAHNFKTLTDELVSIAKEKHLKTATVGDWVQAHDGRTLYIGSRSSTYMIRLYEKYKQSGFDDDNHETVRLEMEIKPSRENRKLAFDKTALELVSSCSWALPLYEKYFKMTDTHSLSEINRKTTHQQSIDWLRKQYKKTMHKQLEIMNGDLLAFAKYLLEIEDWKK